MRTHAQLSACGGYRYLLWRSWGEESNQHPASLAFVMLNPSTADAHVDDPTIRRCIGFARAWGFNDLVVVNLFALRATDPTVVAAALAAGRPDPVGPENDDAICAAAFTVSDVVLAWGAFDPGKASRATLQARVNRVLELVTPGNRVWTIGDLTKGGAPRHPLYLPSTAPMKPWGGAS